MYVPFNLIAVFKQLYIFRWTFTLLQKSFKTYLFGFSFSFTKIKKKNSGQSLYKGEKINCIQISLNVFH